MNDSGQTYRTNSTASELILDDSILRFDYGVCSDDNHTMQESTHYSNYFQYSAKF
jgi:hypothetical protein